MPKYLQNAENLNALVVLLLTLAPILFGAAAWAARSERLRRLVVLLGAGAVMGAGGWAAWRGPMTVELGAWAAPVSLGLEFAVLGFVAWIGLRIRSGLIAGLTLLQMGLLACGEFLPAHEAAGPNLLILDRLSILLVLVVSVVGSVVVVYGLGYMRRHAEHAPATAGSNGRFFFILLGFLGVMNCLVLADHLRILSICWEITTLCSYYLIGHDGTAEARLSARRALLINCFGAAGMVAAALAARLGPAGTESLSGIMASRAAVPMAFLCLAAFTKSAQLPFQSWLLGAMVAPTPVSALLHSATMVKAGSYLILRLAPAFSGDRLLLVIGFSGAFTFAITSMLAVSQSNAKKVLAYSTIGNLGLIVACAGINTPLAYSAALMILCFHAVSKGLLFLCVGTIEQTIGSRDIEDMGSIFFRMPVTTGIMLVGMSSMLLPPFGMLMGKWMAMEAAIHTPLLLIPVVAGSALTVLFWAKWLGRIQTVSYHAEYVREKLPATMLASMGLLGAGVLAGGLLVAPINNLIFAPQTRLVFSGLPVSGKAQDLFAAVGQLQTWPILLFLGLGLVASLAFRWTFRERHVSRPFLCGENADSDKASYVFRSLKDEPEEAWSASLYLRGVFREDTITHWGNLVSALILISLLGVVHIL